MVETETSWLTVGDVPVWPTLLAITIVLIYVDWRVTFAYFSNLGIPGPPAWPLIGHAFHMAVYGTLHWDLKWSKQYGKVYGYFWGRKPFLVVRNPELLQSILVKDFANFCDRGPGLLLAPEPLNKGLFFLNGDEWREVRALMSPTFSGKKLKEMFHLINNCAENLAEGFVQAAKSGNSVQVKELFGAYTVDVIAATAFGLNINSIRDPENIFLKNARKIFDTKHRPVLWFVMSLPYAAHILMKLGSTSFAKDTLQFFTKTILSTMKERKMLEGQQPVDFLQLLMNVEAHEENNGSTSSGSKKKKLTTAEIVAQSFLFFGAGYETTKSALQYMTYNLAKNPEYAEKIYREITNVIGDNEPNYDSLSELVYLDQCLNETLRLHTPVHTMSRIAGTDIKLGQYDIPRGTFIQLPYYGIHQDPETYPDPQEFDPERFSPSAKASRHPMTFCPFGLGPRICIGMRLALLEAKIALVHLLRKVRFDRCPETPARLSFLPSPFLIPSKPVVLRPELR